MAGMPYALQSMLKVRVLTKIPTIARAFCFPLDLPVCFRALTDRSPPHTTQDGHKHMSGLDEAVIKNVEACKQLSKITRTSLGPNGTWKDPDLDEKQTVATYER